MSDSHSLVDMPTRDTCIADELLVKAVRQGWTSVQLLGPPHACPIGIATGASTERVTEELLNTALQTIGYTAQLACSHLCLRAYCEHGQEQPNAILASLPRGRDQTILSSIGHLSLGTTVAYIKLLQRQACCQSAQVSALGRLHTRPCQCGEEPKVDPHTTQYTPVRT